MGPPKRFKKDNGKDIVRVRLISINISCYPEFFVSRLHSRNISLLISFILPDRGKWKKRKEDPEEYNDDDSLDDNEAEGIPDAAKNDVEKQDETALEDEFGAKDYRSQMILKSDCASRPLWVVRHYH